MNKLSERGSSIEPCGTLLLICTLFSIFYITRAVGARGWGQGGLPPPPPPPPPPSLPNFLTTIVFYYSEEIKVLKTEIQYRLRKKSKYNMQHIA